MLGLLRAEKAEFEAVLGTSVEFVADANRHHQRWIIRDRGDSEEAPTLAWDPARRELTSFANSAAEFATTLNLLHTLAWSQQTRATDTPLADSVLAGSPSSATPTPRLAAQPAGFILLIAPG